MSDGKVKATKLVGSEPHDVVSLLLASGRDLLVRNNGDQIKLRPTMLSPKGDFGIVFISADEDDESFKGYFTKMPWLAIPFSDSKARNRVDELFKVREIPHLVILGEYGKVLSDRNESQSPGFVSQAQKPRDQSPDSLPPDQTLGVDAPPFVLSLLLVVAFLLGVEIRVLLLVAAVLCLFAMARNHNKTISLSEAASGKIKDSHEVSPESQSSITSHAYLKSPTAASLDKDVVLRSSPPKFGIRRQRVSGCGGYGGGFELDKSFWEFG
ncbi:hypothetical protein COP2_007839 [Malus domestica]